MAGDAILPDDRPTSRRALFGVLAGLAASAVAGEVLSGPAEQAQAATAFHGKQYATASAAAAAAGAAHSKVFPHDTHAHLLRRATWGARPGDVTNLKRVGIDAWIAKQLDPGSIKDSTGDAAAALFPLRGASPATIVKKTARYSWDAMMDATQASLARQIFSNRQVYEIVVDVFANHLHVALPHEQWHTSPSYISGVIRKYALGRFESMLQAAMKHPAMLNFLSNDESQRSNVNENLGRELLELHTVGRSAGYTETEVRASAYILSGRTWDYDTGEYYFMPPWHWIGHVKVLGFSNANAHDQDGEQVGDAYLHYLAHHPATARNVARKLATRFVSDSPSADLIDRLAHVYLTHDTSIAAVVDAIFKSSDFWHAVGTRMRRPLEDAVGALRAVDVKFSKSMKSSIGSVYWNLNGAGHTPYGWIPPNGYPDVAAAWLGAGAMIQRWNLHRAVVYGWWSHLQGTAPSKLVTRTKDMTTWQWTRAVALRLLGAAPTSAHVSAVIRGAGLGADDPAPTDDWRCGKVAALLLDSPYFQLR